MKVQVLDITKDDVANGVGLRSAVFLAGCRWQCEGCWSPESWDFNSGKTMDIDEVVQKLCESPLTTGITITGGDPFYNQDAALEIIKRVKELKPQYTVWCWTGFKIEALLKIKETNTRKQLLRSIDVLVDSKFELDKRDLTLKWKGSSNQRVIDVQKTLSTGVVNISEYA